MKIKYFLIACFSITAFSHFSVSAQVNGSNPDDGYQKLPQLSQGLHGYISMNMPQQKEGFGYGVSFYVNAWPLLEKPLSNFQIGLPGTWVVPDNRGFEDPLCPIGTYGRDNWPQRGPSYRDVFQTIEGSLGFWGSTQFGSTTAKYRMNGTANCYSGEISSPGWGFGQTKPLAKDAMGMAQLSNHLIIPPDGITFVKGTSGELMGNAWMALPIVVAQPKKDGKAASGDESWTCFLNASNFKGPIAFYIPGIWSKIADNYPTAEGRTLDTREGVVGAGAIEINSVPRFEATDKNGVVYSKIPRLQFPVDKDGITTLMQDATLYSKNAIFGPLQSFFNDGGVIPNRFPVDASFVPQCSTDKTTYDQGPNSTPIQGIDSYFQETMLGKSSYGLKWKKEVKNGLAFFPEYFKEEGNKMVAITASEVPDDINLKTQNFNPARTGRTYKSLSNEGNVYQTPGPKSQTFKATLTDGSIVTYQWYKFIDQPALQSLNLSSADKETIQKRVEKIHASWTSDKTYMAAPTKGKLVTLDKAIIVKPPKGMEVGYVPIVIQQEAGK
ncbi:hypothetical protein EZJ43_08965 [Pedobacter changchengzhani]|uniref:Uncharacterized protein n=1 Tax=Pedobacter changchengzhani TaxID=2529274 RepID=A0A4R5MLQ7_9SPHI|nr:hypothetical protein [Pedobacter changchengzhani]TDG36624.1 hypothetical protein EZJ43_08965 [Pedobacter changchengzhani]